MKDAQTRGDRPEREIPPPKRDPGGRANDDHAAARETALGHQPTTELDPGVDPEHLASPSQGSRPESSPRR